MLGAIAGDIIGSAWEGSGEKRYDFPLFTEFSRYTDDTVMTIAIAVAVLDRRDYTEVMREIGARHPFAGYGRRFHDWLLSPDMPPPDSYGNGGDKNLVKIKFFVNPDNNYNYGGDHNQNTQKFSQTSNFFLQRCNLLSGFFCKKSYGAYLRILSCFDYNRFSFPSFDGTPHENHIFPIGHSGFLRNYFDIFFNRRGFPSQKSFVCCKILGFYKPGVSGNPHSAFNNYDIPRDKHRRVNLLNLSISFNQSGDPDFLRKPF